ncbi:unnamed protein product [Phytophthora fragariaefolia]|uniref:Unnamed protein product n=1 Tax=Phytophthora fragariaefolia TaxID=1490495 RepID=A0A9W6XKI5_9STRA|nr:unnamed protein product [Phytophthora fragariaefolia]
MTLTSIARLFGSFRRRRRDRRDGASQRRLRGRRSSKRVQVSPAVHGTDRVPNVEMATIEFEMRSNSSVPTSIYYTCSGSRTDRLGQDETEVSMGPVRPFQGKNYVDAKSGQKKLRKALEHAVRQEGREASIMEKFVTLSNKADKFTAQQGDSSNRIVVVSVGTASDCSPVSDEDILAEIWAMRSPSLDSASDDDLPAVDDELVESAPMEFLFFTGCPDNKNLRDECRRLRSNSRATRYPHTLSYETTVPIKPTLVSNMPSLFVPRI